MSKVARAPWWAWTWPVLAFAIMIVTIIFGAAGATAAVAGAMLIPAVFAAVYHAEVVAHRIGEPFGTLVLAVAVTIIEVALIVSVMLGVSTDKAGLARDTVFSVVMIVCNGIVGFCLLLGGVRHHEQGFQVWPPWLAAGASRPGDAQRSVGFGRRLSFFVLLRSGRNIVTALGGGGVGVRQGGSD